jgi:3-oxoadipate enol-lactonase
VRLPRLPGLLVRSPLTRAVLGPSLWLGKTAGRAAATKVLKFPEVDDIPHGELVRLRGRGTTYVVDAPGPSPDAPTVVLLHGLASTGSLCWFGVIGELAQTHRVITLDQRWHGRGIASPRFRVEDCADDVAALLKVKGIPKAIIAGYSMGGPVAQEVWRRHPDRVAGLVLASTSTSWRGHLGEKMFFPVMGWAMDSLSLRVQAKVAQHSLRLEELPEPFAGDTIGWGLKEMLSISPLSMPEVLAELGRFDSNAWIGEIDVPTSVVVTLKDKAVPALRQYAMAAAIPDVQVYEAPGGHTSIAFDQQNWAPIFLEAVRETSARAGVSSARGLLRVLRLQG